MCKDNEVKAIFIRPITKIDAEVGDLAYLNVAIRDLDNKYSLLATVGSFKF